MIKDLMVRLDGSPADDGRLASAGALARTFDGHIIGLLLNPLPLLVAGDWDGISAAEQTRLWDEAREKGDVLEVELRHKLEKLGLSIELRRLDTFIEDFGRIAGGRSGSPRRALR